MLICKHWITFKKKPISIHKVFLFNLVFWNLFALVFEYNINQVAAFIRQSRILFFCCVFHYVFKHLGQYSDDFGTNVCLELLSCLRLAGVHFAFQITPQKEIRRGQIWRSEWPLNVASFWHQTFREFSLQKLNVLICSVAWRTILLKPVTVKTFFTHLRADIIIQHPLISISIDYFVFSDRFNQFIGTSWSLMNDMYNVTISALCFGVKRFMVKIVLHWRFKNMSNQVNRLRNVKFIQCLIRT